MQNTNQGFTLIELLIVIAIIGILAAVLIPNLLNARKAATNTAASSMLRNAVTAAEASRANGVTSLTATECSAIPNGPITAYGAGQNVESCQIIQDANSTYGITKSSAGKFFVFNGARVVQRSATAATTVAALSAITTDN